MECQKCANNPQEGRKRERELKPQSRDNKRLTRGVLHLVCVLMMETEMAQTHLLKDRGWQSE